MINHRDILSKHEAVYIILSKTHKKYLASSIDQVRERAGNQEGVRVDPGWDWRDALMIKSACYSCRRPRFGSQLQYAGKNSHI